MKRTNDLASKPFSCAGRNPTLHAYNQRITESSAQTRRTSPLIAAIAATAFCALLWLTACSGSGGAGSAGKDQAAGAAFSPAATVEETQFDASAATGANDALIDASHAQDGYVSVSAVSNARIKAQVISGQASSSFDMPQDGTPTACPLAFGDGPYTVRIMRNTSGNNYVELCSADIDVALTSEFAPFLRPNVYCSYTASSSCVAKARELVEGCENQGDALRAICTYIVDNVAYDDDKAAKLKDSTGYIPDPDETLQSGKGVCFDYASLGAAMLRSQGIPAKIVTGTVSPQGIYHAWIMVNIDGTWQSARFSVSPNTWSRIDLTFAATGGGANVGDGESYTDRYVY